MVGADVGMCDDNMVTMVGVDVGLVDGGIVGA